MPLRPLSFSRFHQPIRMHRPLTINAGPMSCRTFRQCQQLRRKKLHEGKKIIKTNSCRICKCCSKVKQGSVICNIVYKESRYILVRS